MFVNKLALFIYLFIWTGMSKNLELIPFILLKNSDLNMSSIQI